MCSDYANFYGRLWRQAVDALKAQGATVEHVRLGKVPAVGGRPDPMGGKVE
jgi:Asp-tRNA(Asn)/Glu-tRNA(Gln) amidotransferase A subunit family amidase